MPEPTDSFTKWFGDSKVVDANGAPLVVYHGTALPAWEAGRTSFNTTNGMGEGAYFTPRAKVAAMYAEMDSEVEGDPQFLIPVYLAIQNPKVICDSIDMQEITPEQRADWEAQGHDGMMGYVRGELLEIAVWDPTKIKAAHGNSGAYDPTDPDITDRRAARALEALAMLQRAPKKAVPHG